MRAVIIGFSHMHVNEIAQYINDCEGFDLVGSRTPLYPRMEL